MKNFTFVVLLAIIFVSGCGPSQEDIQATVQAGMEQTQAALPTNTFILPTETPVPTATETITPSPTPTPDLRVIDIDPKKILLDKGELPPEGKYILPGPSWISPSTNAEIVASWTVEEGQAYLAKTGRVHGWTVEYYRNASGAVLPQNVYSQAVLFSTSEGAQLALIESGNRGGLYSEIEAPNIGDVSKAYVGNNNGKKILRYYFTYRNIFIDVTAGGSDVEVSLDFVTELAEKILARLKDLPLSNSVTFTP